MHVRYLRGSEGGGGKQLCGTKGVKEQTRLEVKGEESVNSAAFSVNVRLDECGAVMMSKGTH